MLGVEFFPPLSVPVLRIIFILAKCDGPQGFFRDALHKENHELPIGVKHRRPGEEFVLKLRAERLASPTSRT